MADHDPVPEADALEQALGSIDPDPELLDEEDNFEIAADVPEADAVEQSRPRAVPAAASRPIPADAPADDVLEQRLPAAGDDDDDDEFR